MTPHEFAERYLLGVLLRQPERIGEVGPHLTAADFADTRHAALFAIIKNHPSTGTHQPGQIPAAGAAPELAAHDIRAGYLAELRALAPPSGGQPGVYAELVMEASIRRQVEQAGMQVGAFSADTPELAELLTALDTATSHITSAQQRWEAITQTRDLSRVLNADTHPNTTAAEPPHLPTPTGSAPTAAELHAAQEHVIGAILRDPYTADALLGRLQPVDFLDSEMANTLRAASQVHSATATTGRHVDPVTVAWALPTLSDEHGPTPPPQRLHELAHNTHPGDLDSAVDLVMRSSLARLTAHAAATAQQAAQHAATPPADMLTATRLAYQDVHDAAHRMTGHPTTDYQLTVMANRATTPPDAPARSAGQLASMRSRSATLLTTATRPAETGPHSGISARLDALTHPVNSPDPGEEVHAHADIDFA